LPLRRTLLVDLIHHSTPRLSLVDTQKKRGGDSWLSVGRDNWDANAVIQNATRENHGWKGYLLLSQDFKKSPGLGLYGELRGDTVTEEFRRIAREDRCETFALRRGKRTEIDIKRKAEVRMMFNKNTPGTKRPSPRRWFLIRNWPRKGVMLNRSFSHHVGG